MKDNISEIIKKYLEIYPNEKERLLKLINYIDNYKYEELIDWNNFNGHIVSGGFIYAKNDNKFLVLYHKDLKMYVYPGGHVDRGDINPLHAAKREIKEETGLTELEECIIGDSPLIPIDIDTHKIEYNERLDLPEHYHFDFRYLFLVDKISEVKVDFDELSGYKWIDAEELENDHNYRLIASKIKKILNTEKN